ncbi:MAG: hypothetical protein D5S00_08700 [Tindallia sp. MSAO_Bac2]|nr:MAG: hypothetical protein D5S00_08700 [Tindallia sp. MSAO_Bac2]
MKLREWKKMLGVLLLTGVLLLAGCSGAAEPQEEDAQEEITAFEIIYRSEDEVVAYVHGDHWHGSLPEVVAGESMSLGAYIEEDGGEEVLDGDHHALGVALAEGAKEGIASFDLHGDHVHIRGEQEGTTQVVFQFIHDGEVEYETPAIEVKVQ